MALSVEDITCAAFCCLVLTLVFGTVLALAWEPLHLLRGVAMPNSLLPLAGNGSMTEWEWVGQHPELPSEAFLQMPQPLWPRARDVRGDKERWFRWTYWVTFQTSTMIGGLALGAFVTCCPWPQAGGAGYAALEERSDETEEVTLTLTSRVEVRQILTGLATVSTLLVTGKIMITAAFSDRLGPGFGADFEAWSYLELLGISWLLIQAVVLRLTRPRRRFSAAGFLTASISMVAPVISDTFDTAKDSMFAAQALASGNWTGRCLGLVSLLYLWLDWLSLHDNGLGPKGAQALAAALPSCSQLVHLSLRKNSLGQEDMDGLQAACPQLQISFGWQHAHSCRFPF